MALSCFLSLPVCQVTMLVNVHDPCILFSAAKVKYTGDESSASSSGEEEFHDNVGIEEPDMVVSNSLEDSAV